MFPQRFCYVCVSERESCGFSFIWCRCTISFFFQCSLTCCCCCICHFIGSFAALKAAGKQNLVLKMPSNQALPLFHGPVFSVLVAVYNSQHVSSWFLFKKYKTEKHRLWGRRFWILAAVWQVPSFNFCSWLLLRQPCLIAFCNTMLGKRDFTVSKTCAVWLLIRLFVQKGNHQYRKLASIFNILVFI